jgi:hypothetical protein
MFRRPAIPHALQRPLRGTRRLALAAAVGNLLTGLACGEDVLVARFGLTSSGVDGGVLEVATEDAGTGKDKLNQQSTNAQKARAKARRIERANDHPPSDDNH